MSLRRKRWIAAVFVVLAAGTAVALRPLLGTATVLLDLGQWTSFPRPLLPSRNVDTVAEIISIPTRHGPVTGRLDAPAAGADRAIVVLPGVHAAGLDEPRLTHFSRRLAATGINVLSVPLPDLRVFRLTARSTDVAEDVAVWAAANTRLTSTHRVGLVGISFAGGLALVAAGRPSLADRLDAVVSLGGHGDLRRVLEYLCTGRLPDGTSLPPHEYSLGVVLIAAVPHLVPAGEVSALERIVEKYLLASTDDTADFARGQALVNDVRREAATAPEASARVLRWMLDRDVVAAGRAIEPFIDDLTREPALSPERSPAARAPVFLMHGVGDNVIPATETPELARYLEAHGTPRVQWLLTPVLSHVGVDTSVRPMDWWRLLRFWRALEQAIDD